MERIHGAVQGGPFAREAPLPATVRKDLLPLPAAPVTAAMTAERPSTMRTGGGDDDA